MAARCLRIIIISRHNQMSWVRHMNSLRAQTEEIILTELIYS